MNLLEFTHGLAERYAPMSERSSTELRDKASSEYTAALRLLDARNNAIAQNALLDEAANKPDITDKELQVLLDKRVVVPPASLKIKAVGFFEQWWVRYLLSFLFVYIQPKIQNYLNPRPVEVDDDDDDDDRRRK